MDNRFLHIQPSLWHYLKGLHLTDVDADKVRQFIVEEWGVQGTPDVYSVFTLIAKAHGGMIFHTDGNLTSVKEKTFTLSNHRGPFELWIAYTAEHDCLYVLADREQEQAEG